MHKLLLALTFIFIFLITGCSSNSSGNNEGDQTTISFVHWRGEDAEVFNKLIKKFEDENPTIKVKMSVIPSDQYTTVLQTRLRGGGAGDVFTSFPGAQFELLSKAGYFSDLTNKAFVKQYNQNLITNGQKDGKQLAVPYQLVFNQPVYNTAIFEKLNLKPPRDWEGFLQLCETLKENGYIPIAFPGDNAPAQFMNSMVMNNQPDENALRNLQDGNTKLSDQWWVKTLSQINELNEKGYFQNDVLGTKQDGAISLIAQEKAAMFAMGSFSISSIQQQNPDIELDSLAPITVPANEAKYEGIHTSTFMLAVNNQSKKKEAAEKFISFLSQKDIATEYANDTAQHVTVNDVTYTSPALKKLEPWINKKTLFQPRYTITNANVEKAVTGSIQDVLGGTSPEDAANKAQGLVDQNISN
ncbi:MULTISPECIES: ABC transporter substrate-binding protein [Bacillus]|uniref:ABC transporter substrate-binding protein n=2 Tax=Bacillus TaxID=1386 RepID=A0A0M4FIR6_9BACI|nr:MULTISPECIES: extracellular solute-binding protein [Bacillus]ALC82837.1 ABC transporter substrate-binding protein [Bacillus gobiensis]MBP1081800.1 raffinose/stachyose/melibiose transport system substrate-binding protein [Bacillus capparidis]MED1096450.1 extracellular solute-binding protein [Bacillus capparidis]